MSLDQQVVVVDVPAGHGRGALLEELAAADGRHVVRTATTTDTDTDTDDDAALLEQLGEAIAGPDVVVVVDDLHRRASATIAAVGDLCRHLPASTRLLIGGSGLAGLGVGELLLDGRAVRVGPDQLPLRTDDEELLDAVLRDAWRRDVDEPVRHLLDAIVTTGVTRRDLLRHLVAELGDDGCVDRLGRLPLVELGREQIAVDPRWHGITRGSDDQRRRAASVLAGALVAAGAPDDAALDEAGSLAILAADPEALRRVVRAALGSHPPRVGAHTLRTWRESGLLGDDDPHAVWLDGVCSALQGARLDHAASRLEAARAAFADAGDLDGEIDSALALGIVARRTGDLGTLATLVARSHELEALGAARAANTRLLGEALLHQMGGDPVAALASLERVPADAFEGDWAAQVSMMRGTNLLLCGRYDEAVAQLTAATGAGSAWSYVTALQLLAIARWSRGDGDRAVEDLAVARRRARQAGAPSAADLASATSAAMLAALDDARAATELSTAATGEYLDDEARRQLQAARTFLAVSSGDLDGAAAAAGALDPPPRAVLSTFWTVALQTALGVAGSDRWPDVVARHEALRPALDAGVAAAAHLAGGPPAPAEHAPYLPAAWCEPGAEVIELELLGAAMVRRARREVRHRAWDRGRVRELCLHLALIDDSSRELTAGRLWPELAPEAASRNLRVTLSHLLDVLDPERPKGSGSDLVEEAQGLLRFASTDRLRIDVRRAAEAAHRIVDADAAGDERSLLAAARRLAREPSGRFLAGSVIGEWIEPYERLRTDLLLRAVAAAAPAALRAGDPDLAEELARRGLEFDPWAERLHQLLVRARLARDDLDGARRAWREAIAQLDELGVSPERETVRLGSELGLR